MTSPPIAWSQAEPRGHECIDVDGLGQMLVETGSESPIVSDAFALARRDFGKLNGRAFNISGPGNTVSLPELIKRLKGLSERRVELSFDAETIQTRDDG